jgi:fucose 4-O-acetylase-like acetyltransferase
MKIRPVNMGRDPIIDAMKGFGIILVVVGHSIQSNVADFDNNILFRLVYSFHMPLFMFLSGYIIKKPDYYSLKAKFLRLIIPFIVWYLLSYLLNRAYLTIDFWDFIIRWLKSPDYGLWFLLVLFVCNCLLVICISLKQYTANLSFIIIYGIVCLIPTGAFGIGLVKVHFIPFVAGYLLSINRIKLQRFEQPAILLSVLAFTSLVGYWYRVQDPVFIPYLKEILHIHNTSLLVHLYRYLIAFAGIGFSFMG